MLVLAANLEQIEEVGRRGVDGDQVFVVFWCRIWEGLNLDVIWSLSLLAMEVDGTVVNTVP